MNKEIISASCIALIILLSQMICQSVCKAESRININRKIIVIDPGHGGNDTGIATITNLFEKECTLKTAKITAQLLKNKYTVLLTRQRDLNVSIIQRTSFANIQKADIFISLHAKKNTTDSTSFVIYKQFADIKQSESESSASWENEQLKHIKKSKIAAKIFASKFSEKFQADFDISALPALVLQGAQMPAVLIEALSMDQLMGEADKEIILQNYAKAIAESLEKILQFDTN
ncbi:MAG: N-acetylmuramoyl-L-alanine amidase [Desulfobacteraceae bacterium]|nr:N-acetylmuramoyl-L-alanine amidase [Desulfobacteraceae bacterium]